jgi:stage II sporulation protein AA (anti-sigma F factor antagonist)
MSLHVEMEVLGGTLIVRPHGELDHHTSDMLRTKIEEAIRRGNVRHLVLSMRDVSFMDSSGLGVIIGRYKQITSLGGKMAVCGANPHVRRLLEMSGLFKILAIEENESNALSSLGVVS